jgi:hypothetical protein
MSPSFTGRRWNRTDPAHPSKRCFGMDAFGVIAKGDQHLGSRIRSNAKRFD